MVLLFCSTVEETPPETSVSQVQIESFDQNDVHEVSEVVDEAEPQTTRVAEEETAQASEGPNEEDR